MIVKNLKLKMATKMGIAMDIIFPLLMGFIFWWFGNFFRCDLTKDTMQDCNVKFLVKSILFPIIFSLLVSVSVAIGATFITQSMVEEKENRMRETLRIMSLTPFSYGASFLLFQGLLAVLGGIIIGAFTIN
jgi:hypothetical protein